VRQSNGKKLIVAIYEDDGFITDGYQSETDMLIDQLHCSFKSMMGTFRSILGMQIEQRPDGIFVCQRATCKRFWSDSRRTKQTQQQHLMAAAEVELRIQLGAMRPTVKWWVASCT
jgi:hypothetical protein